MNITNFKALLEKLRTLQKIKTAEPNIFAIGKRMDTMWIMTSEEFIQNSHQNKNGKNTGKRSIWFNGKNTKNQTEHVKPQFEGFIAKDFSKLK